MSDSTDPPIQPEDVGQGRPTHEQNRSGLGGFMRLQGLMWIIVILTAVVFVGAILVAAR